MRQRVKWALASLFLAGALITFFFSTRAQLLEQENFLMGTFVRLSAYGDRHTGQLLHESMAIIGSLDATLSLHQPGSEIARLNAHAGEKPIPVSSETMELLQIAIKWAEESNGAFDPTVAPLVKLWGIGGLQPRVPSKKELIRGVELVNYRDIQISGDTVFLRRVGQGVDLGGIAKGYAADEVASFLRKNNVSSALIDLGGNVVVIGAKKDKKPWNIGIQNPDLPRGNALGFLSVTDRSVVTSGTYERFFELDGRRYHHILSPKTGAPALSGLESVTVVSQYSADGDALSTAFFVMGIQKSTELLKKLSDIEAVFVQREKDHYRIQLTGGLFEHFTLLDKTAAVSLLER